MHTKRLGLLSVSKKKKKKRMENHQNGTNLDKEDEQNDFENEINHIVYALADFKGIGKHQVTFHSRKGWNRGAFNVRKL